MISKDLEYIFKNSPYKIKNSYPQKLITATLSLHTNFLKESVIKYKTVLPKGKKHRNIHVQRLDGSDIGKISNVSYPTNAQIGKWLVNDKFKTEEHLQNFQIPTPNSHIYSMSEMERAKKETFKESNNPVVIKPLISTMSKGVMLNVNADRFDYAWKQSCDTKYNKESKILVQNYLEGFEARATIIHGKLVAIMLRIPPYIIGDGKNNIANLIDIKNRERENCGYMKRLPINVNEIILEFLSSQNLSLNYTPKKNEYVLLSSISNVSSGGGELMNITDLVSPKIKQLSLKALASIPGLFTGGVDIMMKSFDDPNPVVLEINSFPGLSNATYPTYGVGTNPAKYYCESLVSIDQYKFQPFYSYKLENSEEHLSDYLNFVDLKQELLVKNYKALRLLMS